MTQAVTKNQIVYSSFLRSVRCNTTQTPQIVPMAIAKTLNQIGSPKRSAKAGNAQLTSAKTLMPNATFLVAKSFGSSSFIFEANRSLVISLGNLYRIEEFTGKNRGRGRPVSLHGQD